MNLPSKYYSEHCNWIGLCMVLGLCAQKWKVMVKYIHIVRGGNASNLSIFVVIFSIKFFLIQLALIKIYTIAKWD